MAAHQTAQQTLADPAQITARPGGVLQRHCACGQHTGGGACESCRTQREGLLQRQAVGGGPHVTPSIVRDVLQRPGQPLDAVARRLLEPRFGHDFSRVRVHSDPEAAESAQAVGAHAYTVGPSIVFGAGQYQPATAAGQRLLAHELTHVVQQRQGRAGFQAQLRISQPSDSAEQEAERVADAVMAEPTSGAQRIEGLRQPRSEEQEDGRTQRIQISHSAGTGQLQRAARFVPGAAQANRNLADQVVLGAAAGVTRQIVNSSVVRSEAQTNLAFRSPTLAFRDNSAAAPPAPASPEPSRPPVDDEDFHAPLIDDFRRRHGLPPGGIDESGATLGPSDAEIKYRLNTPGVEARITAVPANVASVEELVLNSGPWTTVTTPAVISAQIGLALCMGATAASTRLRINGVPSDAAIAAANRTHEDHHAADDERIFNTIVLPWDRALTAAWASNQRFYGAHEAAAEAKLYQALGGTPTQIAAQLWRIWDDTGNQFHTTPAGATLRLTNPQTNADCTAVTADVQT